MSHSLPPNVQLVFSEDLVRPEQRQLVERSVATMAARAEEEFTKRRAVEAERTRLLAELNAQRGERVEPPAHLAGAFDDLRTQSLIDAVSSSARQGEALQPAVNPVAALLGIDPAKADLNELTFPPHYHYFWSWGSSFGGAVGGTESTTGFVGLDARSGSVEGGANGFVTAHAGYGILLNAHHTMVAVGRSMKDVEFEYTINTWGDANAMTEGGIEFTAFENGALLAATSPGDGKLWRLRLSGGEGDGMPHHTGRNTVSDPRELAFTMHPGRGYTFNVGAWVNSDVQVGAGWAAARSLIKADILLISIERRSIHL